MKKVPPRNCEECGTPIPAARLMVLPDTQYCVKCVDKFGPKHIHDPEDICAKSSPSGQNGWSAKS